MAESTTKQNILEQSAALFAENGYSTVSVRDIAKASNIKESTIYYHYKNKRAILDSILEIFTTKEKEIADTIEDAISPTLLLKAAPVSFRWIFETYSKDFLFDPFVNKVMRILMIEQFNDSDIQSTYNDYFFKKIYKLVKISFFGCEKTFAVKKIETSVEINYMNSVLLSFIFKYLLNGPFTEENCSEFSKQLDVYCDKFFIKS